MGESGKSIVVLFELVIGGLQLSNFLLEILEVGVSFLEKFLEGWNVW